MLERFTSQEGDFVLKISIGGSFLKSTQYARVTSKKNIDKQIQNKSCLQFVTRHVEKAKKEKHDARFKTNAAHHHPELNISTMKYAVGMLCLSRDMEDG